MKKIKLTLIVGGKSAEHTIALRSAQSIVANLHKQKYEINLVYVDRKGIWFNLSQTPDEVNIQQLEKTYLTDPDRFTQVSPEVVISNTDIAFPVIHGTYGEDGIIQGVLKAANVAFVGCDILGSAVGMDKELSKRIVRDAGIAIADFFTLYSHQRDAHTFEEIISKIGTPIFIKPANAGSSVGVHKVTTAEEYATAIDDAFLYDRKIIIEEAVVGQEIECAILGNEDPRASVIGEIVPTEEFYSYDAKYINDDGAKLLIPANISDDDTRIVQETAVKAFVALGCEGIARVDFFLRNDGTLIFNEINTFPGFTSISMYPSLWKASGMSYASLLDSLIELGLNRHERDSKLMVDYR